MEFSSTIISAVLIFVLGQISLKLIIEPIQELKKEISEVLNAMVFYSNVLYKLNSIDQEELNKITEIFRKHASNLEAKSSIIPFYRVFEIFRVLPKKENILCSKSSLIWLSNSREVIDSGRKSDKIDEIKESLTTYSNSALFEIIIVFFIIGVIIILVNTTIHDAVKLYCEHIMSENVTK